MVGLDEAHASHVCSKIEHLVAALHHLLAVVIHTQIHEVELVAEHFLLQNKRDYIEFNFKTLVILLRLGQADINQEIVPSCARFASNHRQQHSVPLP